MHELSHRVISAAVLLLLAAGFGSMLTRSLTTAVRLQLVQGVLLSVVAIAIAIAEPSLHTLIAVGLTLLVKVAAIPAILAVAVRRLAVKHEFEVVLSRNIALVFGLAIVFVAFDVTRPLAARGSNGSVEGFPVACALLMLGLFTMIIRKKAVSQIAGLVTMENGVYLAALVLTSGLPLAVELAVAVDVLFAVVVFALFTDRIRLTFSSINTDVLECCVDKLALVALPLVPAFAAMLCLLGRSSRAAALIAVVAATVTLGLAGFSAGAVFLNGPIGPLGGVLYLDSLSATFLSVAVQVSFLAILVSPGYLRHEQETGAVRAAQIPGYYAAFLAFISTLVAVCILDNLGFLWAAIEATTIVSAWLVGFHHSKAAIEAAWKYLLLCSAGITFALFGVLLLHFASVQVDGETAASLQWTELVAEAGKLDPGLLKLAFACILIGFGTKAGFAPLHTWLPDAHSQAPTPVSAVLSAALLNCALYGILRVHLVVAAGIGPEFSQSLLLGFGLLSVVVAAPFILIQRDVKRLLAYSSVEHIGLAAIAFGIGGPLGMFAGMLHLVLHSLAKTLLFFVAGALVQNYGTRRIGGIRGALRASPFPAALLIVGTLAITGAPPLALFISEISIVMAGINQGMPAVVVIVLLALAVAFVGFLSHVSRMVLGSPPARLQAQPVSRVWTLAVSIPAALLIVGGIVIPGPAVATLDSVVLLLQGMR